MGKRYKVLVGLNYPPGDKRAEPGDIVDDLPSSSIGWLERDGCIEEYVEPVNEVRVYAETATAVGEALGAPEGEEAG